MAGMAAPAGAAAPTLERIEKAGVVKLGYRADARPYSFRDEKGRASGYIVDLCREVAAGIASAARAKVRTEYVLVPAAARFEAVRDRHVDLLCDPSSVTLERRELVDFSLPTFLDGAAALSRNNRPVERFEDLKGWRVGVLSGTTTERALRGALSDLRIKADIMTVDDHHDGIDLLTSDRIDAYFADRAIIASMLSQGRRPGFRSASTISPTRPTRWPCRATTAPSGCWWTARSPASTGPAASRRSSPKPSAPAPRTTC